MPTKKPAKKPESVKVRERKLSNGVILQVYTFRSKGPRGRGATGRVKKPHGKAK